MTDVLLEARSVTKVYPGLKALDNADLILRAGEIHALLGENGAGKSSLIKMITGVHPPDGGILLVNGRQVGFASPREAMAAGIGVVHQERNLIPRYSIAENLFLDRLPTRFGLVQRSAMREEAGKWLETLDLHIDPATPVERLSVAQMQLVEIGRALSLKSRILLLDEPTASISEHEIERLFRTLRRLRDQGTAVLFVSHKLEEILALCDRVTVLRDGRNAATDQPLAGLSKADLVTHMVGRENAVSALGERQPKLGDTWLELKKVATAFGHRDIDLEVRSGEVVGLYGLVGAGRSELAKAIIGSAELIAGEIIVEGHSAKIDTTMAALRKWNIGYVSEDRKNEGLILAHSVARNIAVTTWHRIAGALGLLGDKREKRAVRPFVELLDVKTLSLDQMVSRLSGGNQQKISVAKWLAAEVRILIVDEPTVGVDVRTKGYLHQLIWDLADRGAAILLISSDLPEIIELADRIYIMNDYRVTGELQNSRIYDRMSAKIMSAIHADVGRTAESVG